MPAADDQSTAEATPRPWEYVLGFLTIPALTAAVLVGAVVLTPGAPFSCGFVPTRAPWLCDWLTAFRGNVLLLALLVFGGTTCLAMVVGYSRVLLAELLDR
ncbi:hypothetical protein [Haloarchaeobius amylolyticus]|uniref:hypothetical protein n=1 Tax=Haloarchaeobius amylolyticus TaxID=1198296 RepID=UPI0022719D28|nr:hypothetical protein [Haloarchaeobius amylolyticus]